MIVCCGVAVVVLLCTGIQCSFGILEERRIETTLCTKCEDKLNQMQEEIRSLKAAMQTLDMKHNSETKVLRTNDIQRRAEVNALQSKLNAVEQSTKNNKPNIGVSYTRWGRATCPHSVTVMYKGLDIASLHSIAAIHNTNVYSRASYFNQQFHLFISKSKKSNIQVYDTRQVVNCFKVESDVALLPS